MAREPRKSDGIPLGLRNTQRTTSKSFVTPSSSAILYQLTIAVLVVSLLIVTLFCGSNTSTKDKEILSMSQDIQTLMNENRLLKQEIVTLETKVRHLSQRFRK